MNDNTLEGQKKFIQYWVDLYNYAYETGDSHLMRLISDSRCEFCNFVYKKSAQVYSEDQAWRVSEGTKLNLGHLRVQPKEKGFIPIDVETTDSAVEFYDSDGPSKKYHRSAASTGMVRYWLYHRDSMWYMGEVTPAEKS